MSGSSRSSKNRSRTSSRDSTNWKSSSTSRPAGRRPAIGHLASAGGLGRRSPATNSLLPGKTCSLRPLPAACWKLGSLVPLTGTGTTCSASTSAILPVLTCSVMMRFNSSRARPGKRWRLPRLLSFGFSRRSMKFGMQRSLFRRLFSRPCSPACTSRPTAEPAVPYIRARPCAERIRCAAFPWHCPSWTRS